MFTTCVVREGLLKIVNIWLLLLPHCSIIEKTDECGENYGG